MFSFLKCEAGGSWNFINSFITAPHDLVTNMFFSFLNFELLLLYLVWYLFGKIYWHVLLQTQLYISFVFHESVSILLEEVI